MKEESNNQYDMHPLEEVVDRDDLEGFIEKNRAEDLIEYMKFKYSDEIGERVCDSILNTLMIKNNEKITATYDLQANLSFIYEAALEEYAVDLEECSPGMVK